MAAGGVRLAVLAVGSAFLFCCLVWFAAHTGRLVRHSTLVAAGNEWAGFNISYFMPSCPRLVRAQ